MLNDGSGTLPSVDAINAPVLAGYVVRRWNPKRVIDLGSGVGHIVNGFDSVGVECVGVESHPDCISQKVCDSDLVQQDITAPDFDLGAFDLATSFECIEHIPEEFQVRFFAAVKRHSSQLVCSIHVANEQNYFHSFIRKREWWEDWFGSKGIRCEFLEDFPIGEWDCSVFYHLDLSRADL